MDKIRAREIIRELAKYECIILSKHCRMRMRERNVTMDDISHVLMWGEVLNVQNIPCENCFKCEVKGKDFDDEDLTVHVSVVEEKKTIIITVY